MAKANIDVEYCPKSDDDTHCDCWWDGAACCRCGAPADPDVCPDCGASDCLQHLATHKRLKREMADAMHDIDRMTDTTTELATDNEHLRAALEYTRAALQRIGFRSYNFGDAKAVAIDTLDTLKNHFADASKMIGAAGSPGETPCKHERVQGWMTSTIGDASSHGKATCLDCGKVIFDNPMPSQETKACICRPVGAGDGDTYVVNPRCRAHK